MPCDFEMVSLSDRSRSITMLGGITSGALAQMLYRGLIQIRPNCLLLGNDPLERSERLIDIGKRDVLVAFDHPVYDTNTASFASLAHERHAKVLLFTDTRISPIAAFADSVLCAAGSREEQYSVASTVALTEIVVAEVAAAEGARTSAPRHGLAFIGRQFQLGISAVSDSSKPTRTPVQKPEGSTLTSRSFSQHLEPHASMNAIYWVF